MKKLITAIMAMLMVVILSTSAYADSYRIEDLGVGIDIPDNFSVFTRDMAEDNPMLAAYGYTADEINRIFASDNTYIDAFSAKGDYEVVIKVSSSERSNLIFDFNEFTDMELYDLRSDYEQSHGNSFTFWNVEKVGQAKYIVYEVLNPGDASIYTRHAVTTVNGKMLSIALHTTGGAITDEMRTVQNGIVNSVQFDKIQNNPNNSVFSKVMSDMSEYISTTTLGAILFVILLMLGIIFRVTRTKRMVEHYERVSNESQDLNNRKKDDPYKSSYSTGGGAVKSRSTVFESTTTAVTQTGEEFKRKEFLMGKENLYINSSNNQQNIQSGTNANNNNYSQQMNNNYKQPENNGANGQNNNYNQQNMQSGINANNNNYSQQMNNNYKQPVNNGVNGQNNNYNQQNMQSGINANNNNYSQQMNNNYKQPVNNGANNQNTNYNQGQRTNMNNNNLYDDKDKK